MRLILADDFDLVREKYIQIIDHTPDMNLNARWIYGLHPTDDMIRAYLDRKEMFIYSDDGRIAGLIAVTMYQGEEYHSINWRTDCGDDEVASLHILAVAPEYQGKGISGQMMEAVIDLIRNRGRKTVRLDVLSTNAPAQHLYESMGFEYCGKQNLYAANTGYTDFLYYELHL